MFQVKNWRISAALTAENTVAKVNQNTTAGGKNPAVIERSLKRKRSQQRDVNSGARRPNEHDGSFNDRSSRGSTNSDKSTADARIPHVQRTRHGITADVERPRPEAAKMARLSEKDHQLPSSALEQRSTSKASSKRQRAEKPSRSEPVSGKAHMGSTSDGGDATLKASSSTKAVPALTTLQSKMSHKLVSARFRYLNEQLYTKPSSQSLNLFQQNPDMFDDYHTGFAQQVDVWPENPVQSYIQDILQRGKMHQNTVGGHKKTSYRFKQLPVGAAKLSISGLTPLPRSRVFPHESVIADLGCGTAGLANALQAHLSALKLRIHSFDLHSPNPLVTAADIANLPMPDEEVDVAIFCLALMGTNWPKFVEEAWRVLRPGGELWIAEIKSRFGRPQNTISKAETGVLSNRKMKSQKSTAWTRTQKDQEMRQNDETLAVEVDGRYSSTPYVDVTSFVAVLNRKGFSLIGETDTSNKMFVKMRFTKDGVVGPERQMTPGSNGSEKPHRVTKFIDTKDVTTTADSTVLKPCVYKSR